MNYTATYNDILKAQPAINYLYNNFHFRSSTAIKLSRMRKWMKEKVDEFNDARKRLVDKHAKTDEEGNQIKETDEEGNEKLGSFVPKDREAWEEEANDLGEQEVETNGIRLTPEDLDSGKIITNDGDVVDAPINPSLIDSLGPFVDIKDEGLEKV